MEFYSDTKNEILSISTKWLELENINLAKLLRLRRLIACSPSYMGYRPKTNAVIFSDMVTH
jgi:hypothetical protein